MAVTALAKPDLAILIHIWPNRQTKPTTLAGPHGPKKWLFEGGSKGWGGSKFRRVRRGGGSEGWGQKGEMPKISHFSFFFPPYFRFFGLPLWVFCRGSLVVFESGRVGLWKGGLWKGGEAPGNTNKSKSVWPNCGFTSGSECMVAKLRFQTGQGRRNPHVCDILQMQADFVNQHSVAAQGPFCSQDFYSDTTLLARVVSVSHFGSSHFLLAQVRAVVTREREESNNTVCGRCPLLDYRVVCQRSSQQKSPRRFAGWKPQCRHLARETPIRSFC